MGLLFIAFPRVAYHMGEEGKDWVPVIMLFVITLGIDTAFAGIEAFVANMHY